ncbi:MAG TPA: iron ABC transporter permease, partial [Reyranella sp.]|nr:iron ABC transporter permease [Reyranella sp.]
VFDGPVQSGAVRLLRPSRLLPLAAAALVAMPLLSLLRIALDGDPELWPHLAAYVLPVSLRDTAILLGGVAVLTAVAGTGTAWIVTTFDFPSRRTLLWLLPLPLAIPTYIAAYIYSDLLDAAGPVQSLLRLPFGLPVTSTMLPPMHSLGGAIFVFSAVLYPYVYLAARAMFQTHFAELTDAGRMLGARPWRLMRDITLPLARPALAVGLALVMLEALNDIGASEYLGVQTLTLSIYTTWLNRSSLGGAAQIATALLSVVTLLVVLERYGHRRQLAMPTQDSRIAERIALRGRRALLAAIACGVPVALGFLVPAGYLLKEVLRRSLVANFDYDLLGHLGTTVMLATAATCATLLAGLAAVLPWGGSDKPIARACVLLASLGYAVPGTVLALGLLSPLVGADELINSLASRVGMPHAGLMLAGSSFGLILAYCIRFQAIAIGFLQSGLGRVPPDLDEAAQLLGARSLRRFRTIQLPLMRPALWGAALLIFVDCLKELPATLLLRPLNVETLSTYVYQFASRGSFEAGALAALLIVGAGILPIIQLVYLAENAARPRGFTSPHLSTAAQP